MGSCLVWGLALLVGLTVTMCQAADGPGAPVVQPDNYLDYATMKNTLVYKTPSMIVIPGTTKEVQSAILYAKKSNLQPSVFSTGSSYIGRSTGSGRMMINFKNMKAITTDVSSSISDTGASLTMEPGATFDKVYKKANDAGYVIPGANARDVSPTGCSLGGCHGWLTPSLGLLSDNVLAYTVVTANGSIITFNSTHGTEENEAGQVSSIDASDLFWALRGGGGAFAVITSLTFKMHSPPSGGIMQLFCVWKYPAAEDVLSLFYSENHPQELGGSLTVRNTHPVHATYGTNGDVLLTLIYYGPESAQSIAAFQPFKDARPDDRISCNQYPRASFYDFHKTTWPDAPVGMRSDRFSRFFTKAQYTDAVSENQVSKLNYAASLALPMICSHILLGGKVSQFPGGESAISPDYREAFAVMQCSAFWANDAANSDGPILGIVSGARQSFQGYGKGAYYNDPGFSMSNFQEEYFRGKYERLLNIKKKYDPETMFSCRQCVGSSNAANRLPPAIQLVMLMPLLAVLLHYK